MYQYLLYRIYPFQHIAYQNNTWRVAHHTGHVLFLAYVFILLITTAAYMSILAGMLLEKAFWYSSKLPYLTVAKSWISSMKVRMSCASYQHSSSITYDDMFSDASFRNILQQSLNYSTSTNSYVLSSIPRSCNCSMCLSSFGSSTCL